MSSSVILRYQACMWHRNIKKYIWQWREFGSEATCRRRRSLRACTPCCSAELPPSPSPSQWAPCSSSVPWIRAQTRSMSTSTRGNFNPHPLEAHAGRSLILQASLVYVVSSRPVRNTVPVLGLVSLHCQAIRLLEVTALLTPWATTTPVSLLSFLRALSTRFRIRRQFTSQACGAGL